MDAAGINRINHRKDPMNRIYIIVGARPNFMKAAPVLEQLHMRHPEWDVRLIHTGQHYDEKLSDLFFRQLGMPIPDINLNIGSASHAVQTARIMMALETQFSEHPPDLVMVFGDVNSTLAAALVASKLGIPIAHIEAGLRSFDRTMPEEINRLLTDTISDLLFTTEASAQTNLVREGIPAEKIFFVGNTMIDTLLKHRAHALALDMPARFQVVPQRYAVVTLHRPSNVDDNQLLQQIVASLCELATNVPVIFPIHPRTKQRLSTVYTEIESLARLNLHLVEPLGYLEFIGLIASAGVILTDSGGVQEETTILGVPCITLRENTERPVTITVGTNRLVGRDPQRMIDEAYALLVDGRERTPRVPEKWDGNAAVRIVDVLERESWQA